MKCYVIEGEGALRALVFVGDAERDADEAAKYLKEAVRKGRTICTFDTQHGIRIANELLGVR